MTYSLLDLTSSVVTCLRLAGDGVAPVVPELSQEAQTMPAGVRSSGALCCEACPELAAVPPAVPSRETCGCAAGSSAPFRFGIPAPNFSCPRLHFGISSQTAGSFCVEHGLSTGLSNLLLQNQSDAIVREPRLKTRGDCAQVPPWVMGSGQLPMVQTFQAVQGSWGWLKSV